MSLLELDLSNITRQDLEVVEASIDMADPVGLNQIIIPTGGFQAMAIAPTSDCDRCVIASVPNNIVGFAAHPLLSIGGMWTGFMESPRTSVNPTLIVRPLYSDLSGSFSALGMQAMAAFDGGLGLDTSPRLTLRLYSKIPTGYPITRPDFVLRYTRTGTWGSMTLNNIFGRIFAGGRKRLRINAIGTAAGTIEVRGWIRALTSGDGSAANEYVEVPISRTLMAAIAGSAITDPVVSIDIPTGAFDMFSIYYATVATTDDLRIQVVLSDVP